ncbi:MAG: metal ABC transporter permease [Aggregatilineales bacterium]
MFSLFDGFSADDRRVWRIIMVTVGIFALFIPFTMLAFDVSYDHTLRTVAIGGSLLGVVAGVLGCFAVLRKQSLMGDALSHAALPGVTIAFLLAGRDLGVLLIGAGIASWLGVRFIFAVTHTTRIKQDTAMGIVLAGWFALGIALLAYIQGTPDASQAGLDKFIFGQAAAIVESDVRLIAIVGFGAFVVTGLFWKEFKLITFDPEFAGANGFRVNLLDTMLSTLIVVAIVLGLQLAGVILMVGMLIAPAVAARQWTHKLSQMIVLAAVFGSFAGGTGSIISAMDVNIPTGPMIIVMAFAVVFISIMFAPERGLIGTWIQARADRKRFAAQTVLRDVYRYATNHVANESDLTTYPVPMRFLLGVRGAMAPIGLKQLTAQDAIVRDGDAWRLTKTGVKMAHDDERNQQLWDLYRRHSDELALPLIKEDRQVNIREVLPDEAVNRLELALATASDS